MIRKQLCILFLSIFVLFLSIIFLLSACSGKKTEIAKAEMDIRAIRMALLRYAMQDGTYPTTEQGLQALVTKPTLPPEPAVWEGPYIDPEFLVDPWNNKYIYRSPSTEDPEHHKYDLFSYGPDGKKGGGDDITVRDIEKKLEGK